METGIDKEQIEALKALARRTAADPIQLRFVVSLLLLVVGYLAVASPLADRIAAARSDLKDARKTERLAEDVVHFTSQIDAISPRLTAAEDIIDWQNYVLHKLDEAGVQLHSFEPKKTEGKGAFKVVGMEVLIRGQNYEAMVDFVDRMEHGERIVRVEKVLIERQVNSIQLTVALRGLVKPGLRSASDEEEAPGDEDGAATGGDEAAGEAPAASGETGDDDDAASRGTPGPAADEPAGSSAGEGTSTPPAAEPAPDTGGVTAEETGGV